MSTEAGQMFIQLIKEITSATKRGDIQWCYNNSEFAETKYKGVLLSFSHPTHLLIVHNGGGLMRSNLPPSYRQEINQQSKLLRDAIVAQTGLPEAKDARYARILGALLDKTEEDPTLTEGPIGTTAVSFEPDEEEPSPKQSWWQRLTK